MLTILELPYYNPLKKLNKICKSPKEMTGLEDFRGHLNFLMFL